MKKGENTANKYACYQKKQQIILYILWKNYTLFCNHLMGSHSKFYYEAFYFYQCFQYILQLIYQLITSLYTYSFYNPIILLCLMIYEIYTHDSKQILYPTFLCQLILYIHICISFHSIFIYCYKHI